MAALTLAWPTIRPPATSKDNSTRDLTIILTCCDWSRRQTLCSTWRNCREYVALQTIFKQEGSMSPSEKVHDSLEVGPFRRTSGKPKTAILCGQAASCGNCRLVLIQHDCLSAEIDIQSLLRRYKCKVSQAPDVQFAIGSALTRSLKVHCCKHFKRPWIQLVDSRMVL